MTQETAVTRGVIYEAAISILGHEGMEGHGPRGERDPVMAMLTP